MTSRIVLTLTALLCCAAAGAQQNAPDRIQSFAALPAWTGLWEGEVAAETRSDDFDKTVHKALEHPQSIPVVAPPGVLDPAEAFVINRTQLQQEPPYNTEWKRKYARWRAKIQATPASAVKAGSIMACNWDFPELMDNPFDTLFQIFVTPEETLMLFANGQARHLYTDRPHPKPDDLWPTDVGNSVGRWEGDTLVIDTIEHRAGPFVKIPFILSPDLSEKAHFTERLRMTDPDTLQDDMMIEDPERLAHPWSVRLKFRRVKDLDRLIPTNCSESNRFRVVNGQVTIAPH
jgi:hypothetical protein